MTTKARKIFKEVIELSPIEKADLVERLLSSLDRPDKHINNLWRKEVEGRIKAYKSGEIKSVSMKEVLAKYQR